MATVPTQIRIDETVASYDNLADLKKALEAQMYQVKLTSDFKKSYKRIKKRGLEMALLDEVIEKLRL